MNKIEGYKAFSSDLKCNDFQYEIGKTYEAEEPIICCKNGFHFCENPLDVLSYFSLTNVKGKFTRFAKVEGYDKFDRNIDMVYTSKLKIIEEISLEDYLNLIMKYNFNKYNINSLVFPTSFPEEETDTWYDLKIDKVKGKRDYIILSAERHSVDMDITSNCVDLSNLSLKSDNSRTFLYKKRCGVKVFTTGINNQIKVNNRDAQIYSHGNYLLVDANSKDMKLFSTGDHARISSTENLSLICSTGDWATIQTNGCNDQIYSSGYSVNIHTTGHATRILSNGYDAKIESHGNYNVISSNKPNATIVCTGKGSEVKAKKGSQITLVEYQIFNNIPTNVKTEIVDGKRIKEDTFYTIMNGEFVEAI